MFAFAVADKKSMSIEQLNKVMSYSELEEWGAYYMLQDSEQVERINNIIAHEASDEQKNDIMRKLFKRIK